MRFLCFKRVNISIQRATNNLPTQFDDDDIRCISTPSSSRVSIYWKHCGFSKSQLCNFNLLPTSIWHLVLHFFGGRTSCVTRPANLLRASTIVLFWHDNINTSTRCSYLAACPHRRGGYESKVSPSTNTSVLFMGGYQQCQNCHEYIVHIRPLLCYSALLDGVCAYLLPCHST